MRGAAIGMLVGLGALAVATPAAAEIKIGLTISNTGPAAALGVPEMKAIQLLPSEVAGEKITWIPLDDGSDPTKSAANARKLIAEDTIDALVGSTITPASIPLIDIVSEAKLPLIAINPATAMVEPQDAKRRWVFKVPPNTNIMVSAVLKHMQQTGVKTLATFVFSDAYGQTWSTAAKQLADQYGLKVVDGEEYARTDTSVSGQALKILSIKPDAVLVGAAGSPGVLPAKTLRERGYKGAIYGADGLAGPDYVRVGGKDVEGTFIASNPFAVASQLPDENPMKAPSLAYQQKYQAANNAAPPYFAAIISDAGSLLETAIPIALKSAKPGTAEFRAALRDALETGIQSKALITGVYTFSDKDHAGLDAQAAVVSTIKNGVFTLVK
jgi:branched-chain amino acid transport system substrate-binding protein